MQENGNVQPVFIEPFKVHPWDTTTQAVLNALECLCEPDDAIMVQSETEIRLIKRIVHRDKRWREYTIRQRKQNSGGWLLYLIKKPTTSKKD